MISPEDAKRGLVTLTEVVEEDLFTPLKDELGAEEADEEEDYDEQWLTAAMCYLDRVDDLFTMIPSMGFKNLMGMDAAKAYLKLKRELRDFLTEYDMKGVGE